MNIRMRPHAIRVQPGPEPIQCIHCGGPTDSVGELTEDGELVEFCSPCGQNYIVEDAPSA